LLLYEQRMQSNGNERAQPAATEKEREDDERENMSVQESEMQQHATTPGTD